jgi:hypothetical protein
MFAPADIGMQAGHARTVVQNNLFTGRDLGIRVFSAPGIRILNNTVWGTELGHGSGVELAGPVGANLPTTGALLRNNILKRLDIGDGTAYRDDHNLIVTGPRAGPHDLFREPRFASPPDDWRLAPGSPGRRAGTLSGAPRRDRTGRPRPRDPDLGSEQA